MIPDHVGASLFIIDIIFIFRYKFCMDHHRRRFCTGFAAIGGTSVLSLSGNSFAKTSFGAVAKSSTRKNEQDVILKMAEAGHADFVLLNKKNSMLYMIQDRQFFLETPVIIGRHHAGKSLTPSGIFSLTNVFRGATQPKMMFHHDATSGYLMHEVAKGRESALMIDDARLKRLSDGCVNVPNIVLPYILGFARQKALSHPENLATPLVIMDEKYSAPQFSKELSGFSPQKYNPD